MNSKLRNFNFIRWGSLLGWGVLVCVFLIFSTSQAVEPEPKPITQAEAQDQSGRLFRVGSDRSLQESTGSAMRALLQLGNRDLKGAINHAYQSYNSFKRSENLDYMQKQQIITKAMLGNPQHPKFTKNEVGVLLEKTTYRRLDPKFLAEDQYSPTVKEFERTSGMKGDDLLRTLSTVSEMNLKTSDPQALEKAIGHFDEFIKTIPNKPFRDKVLSARGLFPSASTTRLMAQVVQGAVKLSEKFVVPGFSPDLLEKLGSAKIQIESDDAKSRTLAAGPSDAIGPPLAANETLEALEGDSWKEIENSHSTVDLYRRKKPEEIADNSKALTYDEGVIASIVESDGESLFRKVNRKYRTIEGRWLKSESKTESL